MKITPTAKAPSTYTEPCGRCNGQGEYTTRLGAPGQDPREIGGYINVKWGEPSTHPCGACDGSGERRKKPTIKGRWIITENSHTPNRGINPYMKGIS